MKGHSIRARDPCIRSVAIRRGQLWLIVLQRAALVRSGGIALGGDGRDAVKGDVDDVPDEAVVEWGVTV
jgi:hypothetical protein